MNIGLLGYGTVGRPVAELLDERDCGIRIRHILRRPGHADGLLMTDSLEAGLNDPEVTCIVEALPGRDPALSYIRAALAAGKHVVTSNKAAVAADLKGLAELARANKSLGKFQLTGIPAARRGVPQIEVTVDIDANGSVKVSAKDKGTGKEQQSTISGSTALSDDEVDRMVKDAEAHAEEDKKQKEEVEVRNQTDSLCYSTEQTLNELGDKVSADVKSKAEAAIADAKKALEGSAVAAIKAAGESLQSGAYELAQVVYADAQQQTDGAAGAQPADDDVVDADYEVVDDEDK